MRFIALAPLKFTNKEIKAGDSFIPKNEDIIRPLLDNGIVRSLVDVLSERYRELCRWLKSYPATADEIKEHSPELYQAIQDTITEMDNCFYKEDYKGFVEGIEKVKSLYSEAIRKLYQ